MGTGFAKKKKQAKLMQQQMMGMQDKLRTMEVTGTSAGSLVSIVLTGDQEMKSVHIKPECVDKEDIHGLELLIKDAYQDALKKLHENSQLPDLKGFL